MQISKAGSLNNSRHIAGFSLVELIVVLFILSILALFTIPQFNGNGLFQDETNGSRALVELIQTLKLKAVKEDQDFFLHLDLVSNRAWVSSQTAEGDKDGEKQKLLENLNLTGIELLNEPDPPGTDAVIRFSGQGYCDMALIHMEGEEGTITLRIRPFLPEVDIIQGNQSFQDCI